MTKNLSNRMWVMGFVAMWMVVIIHFSFISGGANYTFVRDALTQWAVPWFFFVSGTFAVRSLAKDGWRRVVSKKFWGLVVPYAIWILVPMLKATFFVYCCHGPILTLIGRQGWSCPFGVYFFVAPLVFFGLAAAVRRITPHAYLILSGGR